MSSNAVNNDDMFENFLKYDLSDEQSDEENEVDEEVDDEFFDALNDSCDKTKRRNERLKSVSSENLSVTSLDEIAQMRNEQFQNIHLDNIIDIESLDLNQLTEQEEILKLKSIVNKKLRDELLQIRSLNTCINPIDDNLTSYGHSSPTNLTDTTKDEDSEDSLNKNDKYKTWPANNNVQHLLNSINETQNTATHLKQTNSVTNDKIKTAGLDTMKQASGSIGTQVDEQESNNVANSIQSADEFISPVDKQIAAIFRMTNPNDNFANNGSGSSEAASKKTNKKHTMYANSSDFFDDEIDFDDDDDEDDDEENDDNDEEDEYGNSDKSEIKSLDHNTFKRIYKASNLDNLSIRTSSSPNSKSKTRESIRKVFNRFGKVVKHVQNKAEEVLNSDQISESDSDDINVNNETTKAIKFKAARSNKSSHEFANAQIVQILNSNNSMSAPNNQTNLNNSQTPAATNSNCIIWAMKFSPCGKLLATAGKDQQIRIWVLKSFYEHFKDLFKRHNNNLDKDNAESSFLKKNISVNTTIGLNEDQAPFNSKPFLVYSGHTSDILDVSWSKNLFILSSSSDKSCRLWHIYKTECLCTFYHSSIVSAISFHPKDDRYFISACLDGKLRLWNISDKKIVLWNDLNNQNKQKHNFITAISFCQSGRTIAVGTFDGKCILYHTEQLKYYSLINVRSTRGKNKRGSKITGIEVLNNDENKLLITSNDSRIRLYDLRDLSLVCKYKGFSNSTVHIKASLSYDDSFIISGSKNKCTYIWRTNYNFSMLNSGRRDRNMYWERIQAHNAIVTCALFHPKPQLILDQIYDATNNKKHNEDDSPNSKNKDKNNYNGVYVFASAAGCDGVIKIFVNKLNLS